MDDLENALKMEQRLRKAYTTNKLTYEVDKLKELVTTII
jgi:hypothetical protein